MLRKKSKKQKTSDVKSLEPGTEQTDSSALDQDLHGSGNQQSTKRKDKGVTVRQKNNTYSTESVTAKPV